MLTGSGRVVAALAALLLVAGWLADYPEVVALGLACVAALLVAAVTLLSRPDLIAVRTVEPSRVAEGEKARTVLALTNQGARRSLPVLAVERVGDTEVAVPLPSLPSRATHRAAYPLPTPRRGVHPVGPLTLGVSDPFRLVHSSRDFASRSLLTVHPRVHRVLPVPTGRSLDRDGATAGNAARGGVAFHSLRPYVRGDDPRQIHWRSSARVGEPVVRENVTPNEPRLLVVLDTSAAGYTEESFEDAVRVAASLVVAGAEAGFPVTLLTTAGARAATGSGAGGSTPALDLLAAAAASTDDPGLAALLRLPSPEPGLSLGVVTGMPDDTLRACVARVRRRYEVATLVQVGPDTARLPPLRGVFSVQAPTSEDFVAVWNRAVRR